MSGNGNGSSENLALTADNQDPNCDSHLDLQPESQTGGRSSLLSGLGLQFKAHPAVSALTFPQSQNTVAQIHNNNNTTNILKIQPQKLDFDIHSWSSHSAQYHPKHILVNKPLDQSSRWSSGSNNQMQFVLIKLEKPAVIRTYSFLLPPFPPLTH
jgi:hypothetical protein